MRKKKVDSGLYTQFDLMSENFEGYFAYLVKQMSIEQRNKIPDNLKKKLISQTNGKVRPERLKFVEMLFLMTQVFDKKWYIVIENTGEDDVVSKAHFDEYKRQIVFNEMTGSEPDKILRGGAYILGDRELIRSVFHMNDMCVSGAYNYALKLRNVTPKNIFKERKALYYFVNILQTYEVNKRRIIRNFGISMAEMYCLFYLYDGIQKKASPLYEEVMANSLGVNKYGLLKALKSVVDKKYVEKFGKSQDTSYSITSFGISIVNDILVKYVTP